MKNYLKNNKQKVETINGFQEVSVNVILTFQEHPHNTCKKHSQKQYDMNVFLLKSEFRSSTVPNEWKIFGEYSPEKHVLGQVIQDIKPKKLKENIGKISLQFDYKNIPNYWGEDDEFSKDFSFVERTFNSYFFHPDQRDAFEENIIESFGNSKKVEPFYKTFPHLDTQEHRDGIERYRNRTLGYFKL